MQLLQQYLISSCKTYLPGAKLHSSSVCSVRSEVNQAHAYLATFSACSVDNEERDTEKGVSASLRAEKKSVSCLLCFAFFLVLLVCKRCPLKSDHYLTVYAKYLPTSSCLSDIVLLINFAGLSWVEFTSDAWAIKLVKRMLSVSFEGLEEFVTSTWRMDLDSW